MTPEETNPSHLLDTLDWGPAPEVASQVRDWIERSGKNPAHFIGGEWVSPAKASRFPSRYPATGEVLRDVLQGTPEDVDKAVQAARGALAGWQQLGTAGRARHLYAIARAIQKESRLFAVLETLDNGKPIRETRDIDIPLVIRHFYHHAGWARILEETDPGVYVIDPGAVEVDPDLDAGFLGLALDPGLAHGELSPGAPGYPRGPPF